MLLVLVLLIFTILLLFFYFGKLLIFGKQKIVENSIEKINSNGISLAENSKNLEKSSQSNDPENAEETEMVIELHTEAAPVENYLEEEIQIKVPEVEEDTEKTPAGSPKSTSSCISSEILSEQSIEFSSISPRPSSFPLDFATSSYSAPLSNFTRETPNIVPRMMSEEFESLHKCIEKRKSDIRDLLRRIQSAKRRHRRFSEHLQQVQHDHHIDY
ncbi:uncharacterized protein CELE_Y51H4A.1 [Caenorhabditis elegans]|uniref:Transmembrane protein n=1 Tax=Caenorhabditis elegans TaxID=6239 RepID=Q9NAE5_CAEEL|nr:Transmembrane protein [Caenorhabditis elegans]CAB61134.2 Transmembrane protein [Caenorhabditis elegans]|eukprot:NP_502958.2 Uncharacterized protein CELE_Y51H4A.1 [Caenorhabditis elegans]